nr:MAG TPA: hypothetical protein [Caudoviricetes sp.]
MRIGVILMHAEKDNCSASSSVCVREIAPAADLSTYEMCRRRGAFA